MKDKNYSQKIARDIIGAIKKTNYKLHSRWVWQITIVKNDTLDIYKFSHNWRLWYKNFINFL